MYHDLPTVTESERGLKMYLAEYSVEGASFQIGANKAVFRYTLITLLALHKILVHKTFATYSI